MSKNEIPTIRTVECPACKKLRLSRYVGADGKTEPVNTESVDVRGEKRYLDVCVYCIEKYKRSDKAFVMENMKKLSKAFNNDAPKDTDHKDFSLNID